ncbi:murein L,D-transpeptidase catalytic domain-containing protein [Flavobacterium caseinilyticum]|uniref:Peptidase n=1 Tax=Flavobacterium caseinilyticum TaxID=2541732 RepID=A0A4R5APP1_9FLAO|nr:murein L,D-transpeptidase catalytic domain family protein [Flavobacterium caseinilyticum]TDD74603.1 peptidase [Flavobacterium caseinilyticum]
MIHLQTIIILFFTFLFGCTRTPEKPYIDIESTRDKAKQALTFCNTKNFNTDFCILIDMSLHSGVKRFIVWDFKNKKIKHSFLVGHGCCDNPWSNDSSKDKPKFSNSNDSHCSSLGKYKIGERAYSSWGVNTKYVLHGLEPTNSNALKRFIVFHSWDVISDKEVYPNGTPEGWGCPTISNNSFKIIDPFLKSSSKPVLMWIYK